MIETETKKTLAERTDLDARRLQLWANEIGVKVEEFSLEQALFVTELISMAIIMPELIKKIIVDCEEILLHEEESRVADSN